MVLGHQTHHGRREPARRGVAAYLADVDGDDRAARTLAPLQDLACTRERPDQPVEVGDDQHVGLAVLDQLDRPQQTVPTLQRRAARTFDFAERLDELQLVALARLLDPLPLLVRADGVVALAGDAHDTDGATQSCPDGFGTGAGGVDFDPLGVDV